ncbi:MAG: ABC transporter substrate-binding protein [Streptosporangiaceae bacterium]|nr:ABC transporter substrate-binding protein [Streptosporangiaceae bacterium]MBV9853243.1 ABC transporter substrate-binding protein [Streptosporangiaceae bacterium]
MAVRSRPDGSPLSRRNFVKGAGAVMAAAAAAPALAACGSGGTGVATSGGRTTITFASAKFFAQESIGQIVDEYNNSQRLVSVQFQELPTPSQSTEVHQQLVQSLSRRDGSIDVFTGDIIWISEFAGAGWSAPLDSYFGPSVKAQYFPGVIDACTYAGAMHALPWFIDAGMLYYRKDLLAAAGVAVPASWSELVAGAQKLLGAGKVSDGYNWQAKQAEVLVCDLVEFIGSNGGSILAPDGKTVTIAEPNAVQAVQLMVDTFSKDKITPKSVLSWDEVPSELPFLGGKAAFLRNWSFVWNDAQNKSSSAVAGKVGVAKLPAFPGGKSTACLGGYQFGMNASSTKKSAAIDFLTWMSSPATQLKWATQLGLAPSRPSVYKQPELAKVNPFMVSLQDIFTGGTPRPKTPKYSQISLAIQAGVSAALATGEVASNLSSTKAQIEQIIG